MASEPEYGAFWQLFDFIRPYANYVTITIYILSVIHNLSGFYICWQFHKRWGTGSMSTMYFFGNVIMNILNIQCGNILHAYTVMTWNWICLVLSLAYSMIFFYYSHDKLWPFFNTGMTAYIALAVYDIGRRKNPTDVKDAFGFLLILATFGLIVYPLVHVIREIIKKKSTASAPLPIILTGTFVTFTWMVYGLCLRNTYHVVKYFLAWALGMFQLGLIFKYRKSGNTVETSTTNRREM